MGERHTYTPITKPNSTNQEFPSKPIFSLLLCGIYVQEKSIGQSTKESPPKTMKYLVSWSLTIGCISSVIAFAPCPDIPTGRRSCRHRRNNVVSLGAKGFSSGSAGCGGFSSK